MWDGPSFQTYYGQAERLVAAELDKESPEYLLRVNPDEYLDYLVDKVAWQPLEWHESEMTVEPVTVKQQRHDGYDGRQYLTDAQQFRLRIPITPHPQLRQYLEFRPSTIDLGGEPDWQFERDVLVLDVDATEEAVRKAHEKIKFWLGGRNRDIEVGNRDLRDRIRQVWESRRRRLEEQRGTADRVLEKLNIPLYQDPHARVKPVEIRPRTIKTIVGRPSPRAAAEPAIRRDDILALVDFIDQYARQFEVAPRTYSKMTEEGLRDLIVSMLNANYPGSTTAETFNKLGKTDIRLQIAKGDVLIAECKMWSGPKAYVAGLEQLFRYLTWRQNYGILITFCGNKAMTHAVRQAKDEVGRHESFTANSLHVQAESRFLTRHRHPQDEKRAVEVFHIFVDLSV